MVPRCHHRGFFNPQEIPIFPRQPLTVTLEPCGVHSSSCYTLGTRTLHSVPKKNQKCCTKKRLDQGLPTHKTDTKKFL